MNEVEYEADRYIPLEELEDIVSSRSESNWTIHGVFPYHKRDAVAIIWERRPNQVTTKYSVHESAPEPHLVCSDFIQSTSGMICTECGKPVEVAIEDMSNEDQTG